MQFMILGESAPYPAPGGATTGYLVNTGEGWFLIDCGSGILAASQRVEELAREADLFVCEATWLEKDQGSASIGHLTTRQAAEMAI